MSRPYQLKFTPLEFETLSNALFKHICKQLKFTPLEFETLKNQG